MSLLASLLIIHTLHGPAAAGRPSHNLPADSIGQETRGGQRFVRHRVAQGETLFALSRHYHVAVDQITAVNPQLKNGLGIGIVVLIPRPGGAGPKPAKATAVAPPAAPANRYTVAKGETLFGIARRFGVAPAELMRLNHLSDGAVRVGQELILPAEVAATPAEAAPPAAKVSPPVAAPEPAPEAPKLNPAKEAQIATVTPEPPAESKREEAPRPPKREETQKHEEVPKRDDASKRDDTAETKNPTRASELAGRKVETGIAAPIGNSGTDKYLALHKTAPVGTIMEIKNQMNGQRVYVRVIGTLPDTGENENVLVRLSPRAVQKLGTSDSKFRVETSYVP